MHISDDIADVLRGHPVVKMAWLFGFVAQGRERPNSDLDVAVLGEESLTAAAKMDLIGGLAQICGRPVDLVDLQTAHGVILRKIIQTGERIYDGDRYHRLYAELLKRHVFEQADFAPYRRRLLTERRDAWIRR